MPEPGIDKSIEEEQEDSKLVEFPCAEAGIARPAISDSTELIQSGFILRRPWAIAVMALVVILSAHFVYTLVLNNAQSRLHKTGSSITDEYREDGVITYGNRRLQGWFLDTSHQHFMAADGRRFTYVNSHKRENSTVNGYWRVIE